MTRREELAQVRERAAAGNPRCRWTYVAVNGQPMECRYALSIHDQIGNAHEFVGPPDWADRRLLLGLVDELAAALGVLTELDAADPAARRQPAFHVEWVRLHEKARRLLSELGPEA